MHDNPCRSRQPDWHFAHGKIPDRHMVLRRHAGRSAAPNPSQADTSLQTSVDQPRDRGRQPRDARPPPPQRSCPPKQMRAHNDQSIFQNPNKSPPI
jgi:hypothetical protein